MLAALEAIPIQRNWPMDVKSECRALIRKARKWAIHAERLDARRSAQLNMIKWRIRAADRIGNHRDLNEHLAYLLNRKAHASRNLYAMAQGKRTFLKLGVEHYKSIGRLGAERRWQIHRLVKAISVAAASQIDWRW